MSYKPAISSMSLGRAFANHKLSEKLDQAAAQGFQGIEIFYEDLEYLARDESGLSADQNPTPEAQLQAAETINKLCTDRKLGIICLQPFAFPEGLRDREEHKKAIERLKLWLRLAKALGTDTVQIPASYQRKEVITGDVEVVARDLQEVADLGAKESPPIRFVYENLCWSTYFDTWQRAWNVVENVDRDNFGMCLDTFNIAGGVYGDPTAPDGKCPNAEDEIKKSMEALVKTIDVKKVFYIQVMDAEKMRQVLVKGHAFYDPEQPPRMSWSRNARLFAFEEPGYLPIMDVTKAIVQGLGYKGWISMELFSRTMNETNVDVPREHAKRAWNSWTKIEKAIEQWS